MSSSSGRCARTCGGSRGSRAAGRATRTWPRCPVARSPLPGGGRVRRALSSSGAPPETLASAAGALRLRLCRCPRPSSSPSGTRPNGERALRIRAGSAERYAPVRPGRDRRTRRPGSATTSSRLYGQPRWARASRAPRSTEPLYAARRLRRRLRLRSRLPAARQRRRRDLLDGRHRRYPVDPAEAGRPCPSAARLRRRSGSRSGSCSSGASAMRRPLPQRSRAGPAAVVAYSENEAAAGCGTGSAPGGPPVVFVPFGVDVDAFRPDRGSRAGRRRAVRRRRSAARLRAPARDRGAQSGAELPHRRRSRPCTQPRYDCRQRDARDRHPARAGAACGSRPRAASRCRSATTATRARPRRCSRRWRWRKPVVVSRTAAIADGYELEDGVNCRLVEPGDEQAFERAVLETLTGAAAARVSRQPRPSNSGAQFLLGALYRTRSGRFCLGARRSPSGRSAPRTWRRACRRPAAGGSTCPAFVGVPEITPVSAR